MKKAFTITLVGAGLAATLSLVAAGSFKRESVVRATQPVPGEVAARADTPDLVYASTYTGVAHIIHVPQRAERVSVNDGDEPELIERDYQRPVQRLPRRTAPRWSFQADVPPPPPPATRRAVLSGPPPLADGLSPIRPLPRLGSKVDQADKFDAPDHAAGPPPGG
jgi:hypothetical protein